MLYITALLTNKYTHTNFCYCYSFYFSFLLLLLLFYCYCFHITFVWLCVSVTSLHITEHLQSHSCNRCKCKILIVEWYFGVSMASQRNTHHHHTHTLARHLQHNTHACMCFVVYRMVKCLLCVADLIHRLC